MPAAIPLRNDFNAVTLRRFARTCQDNRQIRRLLALAAVYDGMNRTQAARIGGMDRQTLRDWVHRFNEDGPDGLTNREGAGRPRLLNDEQMRELSVIVQTGPEWDTDTVVRWRRIDLVRVIATRFGVACSQSVVSDYLNKLGFSHISGRPQHPAQKPEVIKAFKKTSLPRSQPI